MAAITKLLIILRMMMMTIMRILVCLGVAVTPELSTLQPLTLRAILRLSGRDLERVGLPDFVYILYRFQLFGPLGIRLALSRASRPMGCGHRTLFFWCSDFFFFFLIVTMWKVDLSLDFFFFNIFIKYIKNK